jgi:hypothetical protein
MAVQVKRAALAEGHTDPWAYHEAKTPYLVQLARIVAAEDAG